MGKVDAFQLSGLDLWFNSNDHMPPHFHAEKRGEWQIRAFFLLAGAEMFVVVWSAKKEDPQKRELAALKTLVVQHREALMREWEAKVNVQDRSPRKGR